MQSDKGFTQRTENALTFPPMLKVSGNLAAMAKPPERA